MIMINSKKLVTVLLTSVLLIGLSGCGNQAQVQAPPKTADQATGQKAANTIPTVGKRAISMAETNAVTNLTLYLKKYNTSNNNWYKLIKDVEIKFSPNRYIRVNTTAEKNDENIKTLQIASPVIKGWAKINCKVKFEYLEYTDKNGAVILKENF